MADQRTAALRLLNEEVETFAETVKTLRGLQQIAVPQATTLDQSPLWQTALDRQTELVAEDKRDTFLATMWEAMPIVLSVINANARTYTSLDQDLEEEDGTDWVETDPIEFLPEFVREDILPVQQRLREQAKVAPDFKMVCSSDGRTRFHFEDPAIRWHFYAAIRQIQRGAATPGHVALLLRSILTMAVSSFEVLVSNAYRSHLMCNPNAAENPEVKTFSLKDLFDFGSVDDAIAESIFQQADGFSRKGIRHWQTWFNGKTFAIDMKKLAMDWHKTEEIFERRNTVVHNGSRATRQYLNNVDSKLTKDLEEGDPLEITPAYLEDSLAQLSVLGLLLTFHVRLKLFRRDNLEETSDWITEQQFELILDDQFAQVRQIAECTKDLDLGAVNQLLLQVNGWISKGRIEGPDTITAEVEAWDTSALAPNFRAAQAILSRNDERAVNLIEQCVDANAFSTNNLTEWPLFYWLREDGLLDDLIMREAPTLENPQEDSDDAVENSSAKPEAPELLLYEGEQPDPIDSAD